MKRLLSVLLVLLMVVAVVPVNFFQAEAAVSASTEQELYELLYNYIYDCRTDEVNIEAYNIKKSEFSAIKDRVLADNPILFYCYGLSYRFYNDYTMYTFSGAYYYDASECKVMRTVVENKINEIVGGMPKGLDDYGKALYLHDYLCVNYEYDLTYSNYDMYVMIRDDKGVCAAYSEFYWALLDTVGIESVYVTSDQINHRWNAVKIDGKWYHVDTTWDDPTNDMFARARHEYFLLSDGQSAYHHDEITDMTCSVKCSDTSLDNHSWHNVDSSAAFVNGKIYMANQGNIESVNIKTGATEVVYTIEDTWYLPDGIYYYPIPFVNIGSYNNKIYYNSPKKIMSLDLATGQTNVVYDTKIGSAQNIYAMMVVGNIVYYGIGPDYDELTVYSYEIPEKEITVLYGDVNGNEKLDAADYYILKRAILGNYELDADKKVIADMNGNGKLDTADYLMLKKAILAA